MHHNYLLKKVVAGQIWVDTDMEKPFVDIDGNRHTRVEWDRHHVIARTTAHSTAERQFIGREGLLLPLFRIYHNLGTSALHHNVDLPVMPRVRLRKIIQGSLNETSGMNPYDRFLEMSSEVHSVAYTTQDSGLAKDARRFAENLRQQTPYILQGQVREFDDCQS